MPEAIVKQKGLFRRFVENAEMLIERKDKGDMLTFSASSETPVERWYGMEVLSHDKNAVRLSRAKAGAMPLLFNHNVDDPIGMITGARVEKNRLMVDAVLFSTDRASEVKTMLDGGLRNVSLAYRVNTLEEDTKSQTFTATDWEPYEVSIVTVPADPTVGIGRSESEYEVRMIRAHTTAVQPATTKERTMAEDTSTATVTTAESRKTESDGKIEDVQKKTGLDIEATRKRAIENFARANKIADSVRDSWIEQGYSLEEVSKDLLNILEERGKSNPQPASRLGLSASETDRFSLLRAIRACAGKSWQKDAPYELEVSKAVAQKLGKVADDLRFFVPFEVMQRSVDSSAVNQLRHQLGLSRRDLTVASAGAGGYLVQTDNVGFIEMLRNRSVAFNMGARRLSGLQGSVTIPRQSAGATAVWLANEASTATESQQTFVQVALAPKNVGAYTEISRQLLIQSNPGAEGIVTDDLARVIATAADLAVLNGSGAGGQPTGIIGTAGIGGVTGTSIAYAGILEFQTDVASSNVTPLAGGYVTTPAVAALLLARQRFTSTDTPLWMGNVWDGTVSGFRAMSSNQMPAGDILFGDWSEVVVAEWGVLEVEVNPYAGFQAGIIGVRAIYSLDVGVRRPFAFSLATSVT
jgi:HK97 family phage major capsid protein/HK97 family phage prohead protease